jgi:hypothetical protein
MSTLDQFDEILAEHDKGKERIATVIATALGSVRDGFPLGGYAAHALKLRGAAVLLQTAALEVSKLCGAYELAAQVRESGLFDEETDDA